MYNIKSINAQQSKSVNNYSRRAPVLRATSLPAWNFDEYRLVFMTKKPQVIFVVSADDLLINVTQYMSAQFFLFLSKATCFD